ncbi:hypothetical protein BD410DRAFT_799808 [Rickenella mellea]|uniref:Hydrophobin n=1 Tax=Rickenella mellea TaxID=50990 RepID=A0A4Y7QIU0_9AGAM|nr:hypothetical protein BD410DRAFT_799808 [Rickenella mellea]
MFRVLQSSVLPVIVLIFATSVVSLATPSAPIAIRPIPTTPVCPLKNMACCVNVGKVGEVAVDEALIKAGLIPNPKDNLVGFNQCRNLTVSTAFCQFNELCCKDNNHAGIVALHCDLLRGPIIVDPPPPPPPPST